jgi:hypothetical protein
MRTLYFFTLILSSSGPLLPLGPGMGSPIPARVLSGLVRFYSPSLFLNSHKGVLIDKITYSLSLFLFMAQLAWELLRFITPPNSQPLSQVADYTSS